MEITAGYAFFSSAWANRRGWRGLSCRSCSGASVRYGYPYGSLVSKSYQKPWSSSSNYTDNCESACCVASSRPLMRIFGYMKYTKASFHRSALWYVLEDRSRSRMTSSSTYISKIHSEYGNGNAAADCILQGKCDCMSAAGGEARSSLSGRSLEFPGNLHLK